MLLLIIKLSIMANVAGFNVYEINGLSKPNIYKLGFGTTQILASPYLGASTTGQIYGLITTVANVYTYGVAETVAQILTITG